LKNSCKGSVCEPGDEGYNNSKWAPNATRPSKIIVTPEETEDVVKAIKYARSQGLPLAVRGGGHSSSTASATDGLLVDMQKMNNIRVDADAKVAYVQAGAKVAQVEAETIKYGTSLLQVGIGGYTIGGGIGYSTGAYGLAVDNLVSATVVLASGEVAQASDSENPDLLWGLRGGGSNFGIVVELGVKLHPQRADAYSISYVYLPSQLPAVVEAINEYRKAQNSHESVFFLIGLGPDKNPYVILNGLSNSSQEEGEGAFNRFLDLKPVNTTAVQVPWAEVSKLTDSLNVVPGGKIFVGAHVDNFDVEQVQKTYDAWQEAVKKAPFSIVMYEFFDYGKVASVPLGDTAFAQRYDVNDYITSAWDDLLKLRSVVSGSSSQAARETLGYANYADPFCTRNDNDEYARKVFGANYARLQEVKKKYDPDVAFDRWFAVSPAA
ncbi:hypothetical protein M407DRAFT_229637, partial [Tulasnella calospora MUT 4182]